MLWYRAPFILFLKRREKSWKLFADFVLSQILHILDAGRENENDFWGELSYSPEREMNGVKRTKKGRRRNHKKNERREKAQSRKRGDYTA